ncbi:protein MEN-8-like [Euphorbia lathyris]|uniref:protein MEN-8-like n=1 Tax=Euphorbia lathyris TaxID=212925 RepID=UPI0033138C28
MGAMKSLIAAVIVVVITLGVQTRLAESQACTSQLTNLNVCAPYVVPGSTNPNPSAECCSALQSVNHDCLCNTLRVAARLPSHCNLQPLNCGN